MIDRATCERLDDADVLAAARHRFSLPADVIYLDGNSLGAMPAHLPQRMQQVVNQEWGRDLIRSWNVHAWVDLPGHVGDRIAALIGAGPGTVIACDSTSINVFKAVSAALALSERSVVLSDNGNFPTDLYVMATIADLQVVEPGDVIDAISPDVAVVALTHVGYSTGRLHDMDEVTAAAHDAGALVVWDLAHSAGALDVSVGAADFAVGCGYKYLNGGPGAPAFIYVRPDHVGNFRNPITGWFGHAAPFEFSLEFVPSEGIARATVGTPHVLSLVALNAALDVFDGVDMAAVRAKSVSLTELFIALVEENGLGLRLVSPRDPGRRGSHVCFAHPQGYSIVRALIDRGVIGDFRAPDIMRFGFGPLYVRHVDVFDAVQALGDVLASGVYTEARYAVRTAVT
ncbi:MAG TPA: kynureninase [Acidimicrobiia bacterium]|nr:kynureninase [Acidimicrobiia bacterium]